jgi:hypothetical protein
MSRQIGLCIGVLTGVLIAYCPAAFGQGRGGQERGLEVLSKTMQMSSTEFIQVPGPNPLLTPSPSGWDVMYNETADIFKDDETYYLYYHGYDDGYQVGVATADHPLGPWTKYEKNPILKLGAKDSWEDIHVACAFVLKEGPDKYFMWYSGMKKDDEGETWGIGLATASHPLGPWTKYEKNPIMAHFGYVGGVVKYKGQYYLYTAHPIGSTGVDYSPMSLAIADKPEGPYTEYEGNPILKPDEWGSWDDGGFSEAEVYYHDGVFHMFYGGTKLNPIRIRSRESIGYAYSFDGIHFTKYANNPVAICEMQPGGEAFSEIHAHQEGSLIYLFHTLRYEGRQGHEDIGVQVLATQRPFKLRMPLLIQDSLAPGATSPLDACKPLCLDKITSTALTCELTYGARGVPIQVHVKSSYDGLTYDTVAKHLFVISSVVPGEKVRQTFDLTPNVKYLKVQVENPSDTDAVADVSVYATVGG